VIFGNVGNQRKRNYPTFRVPGYQEILQGIFVVHGVLKLGHSSCKCACNSVQEPVTYKLPDLFCCIRGWSIVKVDRGSFDVLVAQIKGRIRLEVKPILTVFEGSTETDL
jgi:hypothetical protein